MDVQMPDGTIITGVPDNITQSELLTRYQKYTPSESAEQSREGIRSVLPETSNPVYGLISRGAGIVGSGLEAVQRAGDYLATGVASALPFTNFTREQAEQVSRPQFVGRAADATKAYSEGINYTPSTTLGELGDNPLKVIPFIAERIITSTPDMAAAVYAMPAYITARTNEILNDRLKNDKKELKDATVADVGLALAGAAAEATFERFATQRLLKGAPVTGKSATTRTLKEAGIQSGTEGVEEGLANIAGSIGTVRGIDPKELGENILEGMIVGGGMGAGVRGTQEYLQSRSKPEADFTEPKTIIDPDTGVKVVYSYTPIDDPTLELGGTPEINGRKTYMYREKPLETEVTPPVAPESQGLAAPSSEALNTDEMIAEFGGQQLPLAPPPVAQVAQTEDVQGELPGEPAPAPVPAPAAQVAQIPQAENVQPSAEDVVPLDDTGEPVEAPKAAETAEPVVEGGVAANAILQNRERSSPASIAQMNAIANQPDYSRVAYSASFLEGAPVVFGAQTLPADQVGRIGQVISAKRNRKIPVQYAVVDADQLIASNAVDGSSIPEYASPEFTGFKAVTNGRVAGLKEGYVRGTMGQYKQDLLADDIHGISPDVINRIKNPILVRIMPQDQVTQDIADESNTSSTLALSATERAKNDANRIDLDGLEFREDGAISPETVRGFVAAMPQSEQQELIDKQGRPTRQAYDRLNAAIFYKAYGNDALVSLAAEAKSVDAANIINGLSQAAPQMAQLAGTGEYDIRPQVVQSAEMAINASRQGQKLADVISQQELISEDSIAKQVLQLFANNTRSAKKIGEGLRSIATNIQAEASRSQEPDMFGEVPRRKPATQVVEESSLQIMLDAGFTEQDLNVVGFTKASPELQAEVAALQKTVSDMGLDPVAILETLESELANRSITRLEYYEKAKTRLEQAIREKAVQGGGRDVSQADVQEGAEREEGLVSPDNLSGQQDVFSTPVQISPEQQKIDALNKFEAALSQAVPPFRAISASRTVVLRPQPLTAKQIALIKSLASEAIDLGMPASIFENVSAAGSTRMSALAAISQDSGWLLLGGQWSAATRAEKLQALVHELGHSVDNKAAANSGKKVSEESLWQKAHDELKSWYDSAETKTTHPLNYPFNSQFKGKLKPKSESFAQAFSFYFVSPVELQTNAPEAYSQIQSIVEGIQNESQRAGATGATKTGAAGVEIQPSRTQKGTTVQSKAGEVSAGISRTERVEDRGAVDTDAFKRWSEDAPMVNAQDALLYDFKTGEPFVAQSYHGTNSPEDFTEFSLEALGTQTAAESADMGFFSTSEPEVAGSYASNIGFGRWLSLAFKGSPDLKNDPEAIRLQAELDAANKEASKVAYDAVDEVIPYLKDVGKGNPELQRKLAATMMDIAPGAEQRKSRINTAREKADKAAKALSNYVIDLEASRVPQRIMPIFVKMSNPKVYDAKGKTPADFPLSEKIAQAKKEGHDGVVFKNIADPAPVAVHYVTFKPNQIKSTFNRGTFGDTDNISFVQKPSQPNLPGVTPAPKSLPLKAKPTATWQSLEPMTWKDTRAIELFDKHRNLDLVQKEITKISGEISGELNAYRAETLAHGRAERQVKDFLTNEFRPIIKEMKEGGITDEALTEYLVMRHAKEANDLIAERNPNDPTKQDKGSGVSYKQRDDYFKALDPAKKKVFESLAKKVDGILKKTRDLLEEGGVITKEQRDAWESMFDFYVPLRREESDYSLPSSSYRRVGDYAKSRTGSAKDVIDVLSNIASNREIAINRIEKERVNRAVYGLAVMNPNPDFWMAISPDAIKNKDVLVQELVDKFDLEVADAEAFVKNIMAEPTKERFNKETGVVDRYIDTTAKYADYVLPVKINGKDRFVFFNPKNDRSMQMVQSLRGLDVPRLGAAMQMIAPVTRFFSAINTQYNLIFGAWNFARDVQGARLNLSTTPIADEKNAVLSGTFSAIPDIYKAVREQTKDQPFSDTSDGSWDDFTRHGGKVGYKDQFAKLNQSTNIVNRELATLDRGITMSGAYKVLNYISNLNDVLENATRLSAYRVALDKFKKEAEAKKPGETITQKQLEDMKARAADIAKNITVNFNRKGTFGVTAGSLYAFFNASAQGTKRLYETLSGPKGKTIMAAGIGIGIAQAIALAMAGFDEDEPTEFIKQKNLIIPTGDGKYVMWPMPFGFNVFPNLGRIFFETASKASKGQSVTPQLANTVTMLVNAFNPLGGGGLLQTIAPTVADPFVALIENKDAFGRPISRESRATSPDPGYKLSRDPSPSISQFLAEFINTITFGNKDKRGFLSPTADQMDYLGKQLGGGVYREASGILTWVSNKAQDKETPDYKVPIVGKIVGDLNSPPAISQRFYSNVIKMAEHEKAIKGRIDRKESVTAYMRENPESSMWRRANSLENEISKLNRRRKEMVEKDEPVERIKKLDDQKTRMMKQFNDQVRKYN